MVTSLLRSEKGVQSQGVATVLNYLFLEIASQIFFFLRQSIHSLFQLVVPVYEFSREIHLAASNPRLHYEAPQLAKHVT